MLQVYISHTKRDDSISKTLESHLKKLEYKLLSDYSDAKSGDSWFGGINKALEWCEVLVVVWSKSAAESPGVQLAWETALGLNKKIILCAIDDEKIPSNLANRQSIDFRDFEQGYKVLVNNLRNIYVEKLEFLKAQKQKEDAQKANSDLSGLGVLVILLFICLGIYLLMPLFKQKNNMNSIKIQNLPKSDSTQELLTEKIPPEEHVDSVESKKIPERARTSILRSNPIKLSDDKYISMVKNKGFYDNEFNKQGRGFSNKYKEQRLNDKSVILDNASGLMWGKIGSGTKMTFEDAKSLISKMNQDRYAGYANWRLPTVEEAMSLVEPEEKNGGLHIDSIFDNREEYTWTSDYMNPEYIPNAKYYWVVFFSLPGCKYKPSNELYNIRAVRSIQ